MSCAIDIKENKELESKNFSMKDKHPTDIMEEDLIEIYNQILNKFSILIRVNNEKKKNIKAIEKELE
jgi:hypothetical protein